MYQPDWAVALNDKIRYKGDFTMVEKFAESLNHKTFRAHIVDAKGAKVGDPHIQPKPVASKITAASAGKAAKEAEELSPSERRAKILRRKEPDGFFKKKADRHKQIMPKKKKVRLKDECWNRVVMCRFFRKEGIYGHRQGKWFITLNSPSRKMTEADQLAIMMAEKDQDFFVKVSYEHRHLIIEDITPCLPTHVL